ncbi:SDR family NAD(P)-dependent oxidoreductase [Dyadobacter arcticus]|uniref:NAD(P)-dependent dehydrogenase (Short-subunit alcohol dehydrogenase family) n=1 Tax=Dyadobacter arcticus TaxID=1078754 RepID=A0ABX0UGX9_9BACT|nr:SDR family NAD(P)-dependent oxidoreductase [Dyadobacter arcticus]NIJ52268.1 NAD(P)-dependent dehydrogenase (short-subunit alcohol dehydrogenase family) [Dyadobacter arcticus]
MKTILVTGASGNLGKDVVEHLHQQGYHVLATFSSDRDIKLFNHLPNVWSFVVNVLDETSVTVFMADIAHTDLRAAVLLVGSFAIGTMQKTDTQLLQKMIDLNFMSAFNLVKPLMTRFEQQGDGQFILIGARPTLNATEGRGVFAYALSKALIFELAKLINAEGKSHHTTATVVVPSTIDTPANRSAMPDANPEHWVPTEKIADLISFLVSDTGRMTRETVVKLYNRA